MVSTTGLQEIYTYSATSIYDPDVTGVGHQPLGHDEWSNYYTNYTVIGAKISATFSWARATSVRTVTCGIIADDDTSLPTTLSTKRERYPGCWKVLHPQDNKPITVSAFFSAKKWFARKDVMDSHQHTAGFGASPTKNAYFNVFIQTNDESATSDQVATDVKITYIVKMTEPKDVLGS